MEYDKIIELAKKLHELAKRGEGGEKRTAEQMLTRFLKKHDITTEDIQSDIVKEREFFYGNDTEKRGLMAEVILSSLERYVELYETKTGQKGKFTKLRIAITDSEYFEIDAKIHFYWNVYQREKNIFRLAFIQTNKLFRNPKAKPPLIGEATPLTPEQEEEQKRVMELMQSMKKHEFIKQLTTTK